MGGLFFMFIFSSYGKTLYSDAFVYKISDRVYSLRDLEEIAQDFEVLSCYYQDAILLKVFKEILTLSKNKKLFVVKDYTKTPYSSEQIALFKQFIKYHKLKYYVDSHKVAIKKEIVKAFYLASKQLHCSHDIFESSSEFKENFNRVMRIEVFLRTRYLPEEKSGKKTQADEQQAVLGIQTLLTSVDKQVTQETYW